MTEKNPVDIRSISLPTELMFEEVPITSGEHVNGCAKKYKAKIHYEFEFTITQEQMVRELEEFIKQTSIRRANDMLHALVINTAVKVINEHKFKDRSNTLEHDVYVYRGNLLQDPVMILTPAMYAEEMKKRTR